jgi:hypothetical protein
MTLSSGSDVDMGCGDVPALGAELGDDQAAEHVGRGGGVPGKDSGDDGGDGVRDQSGARCGPVVGHEFLRGVMGEVRAC